MITLCFVLASFSAVFLMFFLMFFGVFFLVELFSIED